MEETKVNASVDISEQTAISRRVGDKPLSPQKRKEIAASLHPEQTRRQLIKWLGIAFFSTVVISAVFTAGAALFPERVNEMPIRNWTNSMVTAQVGVIGTVFGYYFGARSQNNKKDGE